MSYDKNMYSCIPFQLHSQQLKWNQDYFQVAVSYRILWEKDFQRRDLVTYLRERTVLCISTTCVLFCYFVYGTIFLGNDVCHSCLCHLRQAFLILRWTLILPKNILYLVLFSLISLSGPFVFISREAHWSRERHFTIFIIPKRGVKCMHQLWRMEDAR